MSTTHLTQAVKAERSRATHSSVTLPFGEIMDQGTYYSRDTGWIYRVPEESLSPGHSPMISIVSKEDILVTKISDDPWIPVNKARQICSNLDFEVNF